MTVQSSHLSPRLYEALELAFKLHGRDARKGTNVPYMSHLAQVCALVLGDGGDEDEAIAALLHDALEEKPKEISRDELSKRFGKRVLDIIVSDTDVPPEYAGGTKPPWRPRKEAHISHLRTADPSMLRVALADKIDNVRAILGDHRRIGDKIWQRFNAGKQDHLWYYQSIVEAIKDAGYQGALLDDLDHLVIQLLRQTSVSA
jgi:(p)ppGpp synthase/HD superfamily hydrolase